MIQVAFKNCTPFSTCITKIIDVFVDEANHIHIAMPMYNLIEYSNNYSDTSGSLWQFKRDEVPDNNAHLTINNSQSFKYKAILVEKAKDFVNQKSSVKDVEIAFLLKYLINFWISLEMSLINCFDWIKGCILSSAGNTAKLEITDAKLQVPIIILSTKDCAI